MGKPGELWVKGPMVMVGYYKKPDETKNAVDKDGYMHTGDVVVMDDEGYLRIVDRTKDMIIVGGFKVFSVKVEDVLSRHPAVDMVAMIGVPNPDRPGSEFVKAFIQLTPEYAAGDRKAVKKDIDEIRQGETLPLRSSQGHRVYGSAAADGSGQARQEETEKIGTSREAGWWRTTPPIVFRSRI